MKTRILAVLIIILLTASCKTQLTTTNKEIRKEREEIITKQNPYKIETERTIRFDSQGEIKPISADDAFYVLEAAQSILVIPGYGMAVAQAQHAMKELQELQSKRQKKCWMLLFAEERQCIQLHHLVFWDLHQKRINKLSNLYA